MNTILTYNQTSSFRYRLAEILIEGLKINLAIKPLQFLFKKKVKNVRLALEKCPENSVGNSILNMLNENNLDVIPFFENHDLKHLVLGYGMTSVEEIRMQAFLFGNGNRSFSCILFFLSGILLPSAWNQFYLDFKKGKNAPDILNLSLKECMNKSLSELKSKYEISFKNNY
ncbi:MAG: hypothetical protein ACK46Y_10820 [Fluviicola sp.]